MSVFNKFLRLDRDTLCEGWNMLSTLSQTVNNPALAFTFYLYTASRIVIDERLERLRSFLSMHTTPGMQRAYLYLPMLIWITRYMPELWKSHSLAFPFKYSD